VPGSETDRVLGLEVGRRPSPTLQYAGLVARCRALCAASLFGGLPQLQVLQFKDVTLYPQECRVLVRGQEVSLSPKISCWSYF